MWRHCDAVCDVNEWRPLIFTADGCGGGRSHGLPQSESHRPSSQGETQDFVLFYHRFRSNPKANITVLEQILSGPNQKWKQSWLHGPLARYVKLRVAHAPRMPGTFSPPPRVSDPDMHHGTCVKHVSWCIPGWLTMSKAGKTFPEFPAHAQPAILRIW